MFPAVSNLAWSPAVRTRAYGLLRDHEVRGLEIAPGLLFEGEPDPLVPAPAVLSARLDEIAQAGLRPVSMQSLLFGVPGLALFGDTDALARLEARLGQAIDLARALGIGNLVFGSPRNRGFPPEMPAETVFARARDAFCRIGDRALAAGVVFSVEPVAPVWGTNFLTTFPETLAFLERVNHPCVRLTFDTGAVLTTGAGAEMTRFLAQAAPCTSHVHLSLPELHPLPDTAVAETVVSGLRATGYRGAVSLEIWRGESDGLDALATSLARFRTVLDRTGLPRP